MFKNYRSIHKILPDDLLHEWAVQYCLMMEPKKPAKMLDSYSDLKQQVTQKDFIGFSTMKTSYLITLNVIWSKTSHETHK